MTGASREAQVSRNRGRTEEKDWLRDKIDSRKAEKETYIAG